MANLKNELAWSFSRSECFRECKRRYWFRYYGSWGGWAPQQQPEALNAPPEEAEEIYRLKKLTNRYAWKGNAVHQAIKDHIQEIRFSRELPGSIENACVRMTARMREQYRTSRDDKGSLGRFREHEYNEHVSSDDWQQISVSARECLKNALSNPLVAETIPGVINQPMCEEEFLGVEKLELLKMPGFASWFVYDVAWMELDGSVVVVDWKTGKPKNEHKEQARYYGWFAQEHFGVEAVQTIIVYLRSQNESVVRWAGKENERIKADAMGELEVMRSMCDEDKRELNIATNKTRFPPTENTRSCRFCEFRRLCER